MKILILVDYYPPDKLGGVGEIAKNLKKEYENLGHEAWVLTTGTSSEETNVIRSSGSLILGVFLNNLKAINLIRKKGIDIVNIHQSSTTFFLLTKHLPFLYKKFPRVINSFQVSYFSEFRNIRSIKIGGYRFKPTLKEYIEKWLYSPVHIFLDFISYILSDEVTVVSTENKKEFARTYGLVSKKEIKIIPNGANSSLFSPAKPKLDAKLLNDLEHKLVLLYVGVFRVRKRVFNLVLALKEVLKTGQDVVLVLVGGGRSYEKEIMELAEILKISNNVIFVGAVRNEEVVHYLNAADVFCLLSSYEGMPVALLEAMSCEVAALTSRVSGMVDLVENGKDGYLTEVDDIIDTANKLKLLANDPVATKTMGHRARQKIVNQYDWTIIAKRYIKLF